MQPNDPQQSSTPEDAFARAVRVRRQELGLSQNELASRLEDLTGVALDATAITRMEKGERRTRFNEVVAICRALGLDLDQVVADHPGDLEEQLSRANDGLLRAMQAYYFWADEVRARTARVDELQARRAEIEGDEGGVHLFVSDLPALLAPDVLEDHSSEGRSHGEH